MDSGGSLSAPAGCGQKFDSQSPCLHTGVSRRHEHLCFAAETLGAKVPTSNDMAGVSIHALTVSDNPKKFAIAVTRARVDSPSFLVVIPSCCALHASLATRDALPKFYSKPGASEPKLKRIRSLA